MFCYELNSVCFQPNSGGSARTLSAVPVLPPTVWRRWHSSTSTVAWAWWRLWRAWRARRSTKSNNRDSTYISPITPRRRLTTFEKRTFEMRTACDSFVARNLPSATPQSIATFPLRFSAVCPVKMIRKLQTWHLLGTPMTMMSSWPFCLRRCLLNRKPPSSHWSKSCWVDSSGRT